ncbi:unnamed protein product, partial [Prorocentrum cordatum]
MDRRVLSVEHGASLPDAEAARSLLDRVRRNAEAVLQARGWRVGALVELCCCKLAPETSRGGVAGWCMPEGDSATAKRIALRLRSPKGEGHGLLDFECVFDTMLHEIAHIVHSRHTAGFYQLWDELRAEWGRLALAGRVLDEGGFPTVGGQRTGEGTHNPPSVAAGRARALAAAEARAKVSALMGSGRLGGAAGWEALAPRERAALAAERRLADQARGLGDDELPEAQEAPPAAAQPPAAAATARAGGVRFSGCEGAVALEAEGGGGAELRRALELSRASAEEEERDVLRAVLAASLAAVQRPTEVVVLSDGE